MRRCNMKYIISYKISNQDLTVMNATPRYWCIICPCSPFFCSPSFAADGIALSQAAKLETNRNQRRRLGNFANANNTITKSNNTLSKEYKQRLQGIEVRTLEQVISEGKERATRLADCISNVSEQGLFGREPAVTFCRLRLCCYL